VGTRECAHQDLHLEQLEQRFGRYGGTLVRAAPALERFDGIRDTAPGVDQISSDIDAGMRGSPRARPARPQNRFSLDRWLRIARGVGVERAIAQAVRPPPRGGGGGGDTASA